MAKVRINPKKLGAALAQIRQHRQLTLDRLSEETGLAVEYLRDLEAGNVVKAKKKELNRISKVLEMPTPCIRMMGIEPSEMPDKLMGELAESVQGVIQAVLAVEAESRNGDKKKKKK